MTPITVVFENGVFRPTAPVDLPEGVTLRLHAEPVPPADPDAEPTPAHLAARKRLYETLSRSYDGDGPSNVLEAHNDHQP